MNGSYDPYAEKVEKRRSFMAVAGDSFLRRNRSAKQSYSKQQHLHLPVYKASNATVSTSDIHAYDNFSSFDSVSASESENYSTYTLTKSDFNYPQVYSQSRDTREDYYHDRLQDTRRLGSSDGYGSRAPSRMGSSYASATVGGRPRTRDSFLPFKKNGYAEPSYEPEQEPEPQYRTSRSKSNASAYDPNPTVASCSAKEIVSGFLLRHGAPTFAFGRSWRKRYFILTHTALYCFKNADAESRALEVLPITSDTIICVTDHFPGKTYVIEWTNKNSTQTWYTQADKVEDLKVWLNTGKTTVHNRDAAPDGKPTIRATAESRRDPLYELSPRPDLDDEDPDLESLYLEHHERNSLPPPPRPMSPRSKQDPDSSYTYSDSLPRHTRHELANVVQRSKSRSEQDSTRPPLSPRATGVVAGVAAGHIDDFKRPATDSASHSITPNTSPTKYYSSNTSPTKYHHSNTSPTKYQHPTSPTNQYPTSPNQYPTSPTNQYSPVHSEATLSPVSPKTSHEPQSPSRPSSFATDIERGLMSVMARTTTPVNGRSTPMNINTNLVMNGRSTPMNGRSTPTNMNTTETARIASARIDTARPDTAESRSTRMTRPDTAGSARTSDSRSIRASYLGPPGPPPATPLPTVPDSHSPSSPLSPPASYQALPLAQSLRPPPRTKAMSRPLSPPNLDAKSLHPGVYNRGQGLGIAVEQTRPSTGISERRVSRMTEDSTSTSLDSPISDGRPRSSSASSISSNSVHAHLPAYLSQQVVSINPRASVLLPPPPPPTAALPPTPEQQLPSPTSQQQSPPAVKVTVPSSNTRAGATSPVSTRAMSPSPSISPTTRNIQLPASSFSSLSPTTRRILASRGYLSGAPPNHQRHSMAINPNINKDSIVSARKNSLPEVLDPEQSRRLSSYVPAAGAFSASPHVSPKSPPPNIALPLPPSESIDAPGSRTVSSTVPDVPVSPPMSPGLRASRFGPPPTAPPTGGLPTPPMQRDEVESVADGYSDSADPEALKSSLVSVTAGTTASGLVVPPIRRGASTGSGKPRVLSMIGEGADEEE